MQRVSACECARVRVRVHAPCRPPPKKQRNTTPNRPHARACTPHPTPPLPPPTHPQPTHPPPTYPPTHPLPQARWGRARWSAPATCAGTSAWPSPRPRFPPRSRCWRCGGSWRRWGGSVGRRASAGWRWRGCAAPRGTWRWVRWVGGWVRGGVRGSGGARAFLTRSGTHPPVLPPAPTPPPTHRPTRTRKRCARAGCDDRGTRVSGLRRA